MTKAALRRVFTDDNAPSHNIAGVHAFIYLNLISGVGLLIVLLTAIFSSKVKRLPTWYSFCASWILSCVSYSLLFLAGQQNLTRPNYQLCYVQEVLIYAIPPTTSCTTLSLLVQILMSFPDSKTEAPRKTSTRTSCLLLIGPYAIFLVLFIGVAVYTSEHPLSLRKAPQGTYCNSTDNAWSRITFAVVAAVSVAIVVVQANLALRLYRNPQVVKKGSHSTATMLRGLLFTLLGVVMVIMAFVFTTSGKQHLALDIVISIFPLFALLVFGTQMDLIHAWFYWKVPRYKAEDRGSSFFSSESQAGSV